MSFYARKCTFYSNEEDIKGFWFDASDARGRSRCSFNRSALEIDVTELPPRITLERFWCSPPRFEGKEKHRHVTGFKSKRAKIEISSAGYDRERFGLVGFQLAVLSLYDLIQRRIYNRVYAEHNKQWLGIARAFGQKHRLKFELVFEFLRVRHYLKYKTLMLTNSNLYIFQF